MFDYQIALILCFIIILIPIIIFYILRPSIRSMVIEEIVKNNVIKFPRILLIFLLSKLIFLGIGVVALYSIFAYNFDLGLVKKIMIRFDTKPSGGSLILNGKYFGKTPVEIYFKKPGKYKIRIDSIFGYLPVETSIVVSKTSSKQYEINLIKAPIGKITLEAPFSVHKEPKENSPLITKFSNKGKHILELLNRQGHWVEVRLYDGREGWVYITQRKNQASVSGSSPSKPSFKYVTVVVPNVKIRERPSLSSKPIAEVTQSKKLVVITYDEGWYKVSLPDGKTGWVYKTFVTEDVK